MTDKFVTDFWIKAARETMQNTAQKIDEAAVVLLGAETHLHNIHISKCERCDEWYREIIKIRAILKKNALALRGVCE